MPNPPTSANPLHPPRPRLVYRVGVAGHRPDRLPEKDSAKLREPFCQILQTVLEEVKSFGAAHSALFDPQTPELRAISSLAEGSDRLFADAALELGFALCCPMPFAQEEFEKDFAPGKSMDPDSLACFHDLLDKAEKGPGLTRFELDGARSNETGAYGHCGSVLASQSDLLLVVWDGERQGKSGGTEDTLDEAHRAGVPIVWIDAQAPHFWKIYDDSESHPTGAPLDQLQKIIRGGLDIYRPLLDAPASAKDNHEADHSRDAVTLENFLAERKPAYRFGVVWKFFRDLLGDFRLRRFEFKVKDFEEDVLPEWPADRSSVIDRIVDRLRPFYAWPDKLADLYADAYRSVFWLTYLFAALAVGLALMPVALGLHLHKHAEAFCITAELFAIMIILILVGLGNRRHWHERWIQYRLAAELVRHVRLVAPVGGGRPFPQLPAHLAIYGHPNSTWVAWYVRAIERAVGLPTARVDRSYLLQSLDQLLEILKGQEGFHEKNGRRCHRIEKILHWSGLVFLMLTFVACALHLLHLHYLENYSDVLTFLCGFLPALGAAMAGISNQGEFVRIAKRSNSMVKQLKDLIDAATQLRCQILHNATTEQPSMLVRRISASSARLMVNEVLDWRVIFVDRPLNPPA